MRCVVLALLVTTGCDQGMSPAETKALQTRCGAVAEHMTSLDLGNYASPEQRAPQVAAHLQACLEARLSQGQADCVTRTTTREEAVACAATPQPSPPSSTTTGDCGQVADAIRRITEKQNAHVNAPTMKDWFEITVRVMKESCEQDGWTDSMKACTLRAADAPTIEAATKIQAECPPVPAGVTAKIQARLQVEMDTYATRLQGK